MSTSTHITTNDISNNSENMEIPKSKWNNNGMSIIKKTSIFALPIIGIILLSNLSTAAAGPVTYASCVKGCMAMGNPIFIAGCIAACTGTLGPWCP